MVSQRNSTLRNALFLSWQETELQDTKWDKWDLRYLCSNFAVVILKKRKFRFPNAAILWNARSMEHFFYLYFSLLKALRLLLVQCSTTPKKMPLMFQSISKITRCPYLGLLLMALNLFQIVLKNDFGSDLQNKKSFQFFFAFLNILIWDVR